MCACASLRSNARELLQAMRWRHGTHKKHSCRTLRRNVADNLLAARSLCLSSKNREWCVVVECDVISFRIDDNYRSALTGTVY